MKSKVLLSIVLVMLLSMSACSPAQGTSTSTPAQSSTTLEPSNSAISEPEPQDEYVPLWTVDEFRKNEEDVMFFVPATDDYMLTEVYNLVQPDSGIVYTLTVLRSFDESGAVVQQVHKLYFNFPPDARYCYDVFKEDGTDYPTLVCVGYAVYVEQTADIIAEQRTKEQFVSDYQADGTKHWLSIEP